MTKLDAYGHLNWTVGNEDWIACFDARRVRDGIEYHVVVNCESGGFIGTMEKGTVPATVDGIAQLTGLPDRYADYCFENYPTEADEVEHGKIEWEDTDKAWREHLQGLLKEEAEEEDTDSDEEARWYEELNRGYANDRI